LRSIAAATTVRRQWEARRSPEPLAHPTERKVPLKKALGVVVLLALLPSCASIVSKSDWPVAITSPQPGVPFTVKNSQGISVASGTTPSTITLKSGAGFFEGADYTVEATGHGSVPVVSKLNGWYWGNLLFGGLIGMLIVDPATGAMWKLPETIQLNPGVSP
jgi:hypothetical protein